MQGRGRGNSKLFNSVHRTLSPCAIELAVSLVYVYAASCYRALAQDEAQEGFTARLVEAVPGKSFAGIWPQGWLERG